MQYHPAGSYKENTVMQVHNAVQMLCKSMSHAAVVFTKLQLNLHQNMPLQ